MQKIYTPARNLIYAINAELSANNDFTVKDTTWKPTAVEKNLVALEISLRTKELVEDAMHLSNAISKNFSERIFFTAKDKDGLIWEAKIESNGVESYYFARMYFVALAKLKSGFIDMEHLNCDIIERYTTVAAVKVIKSVMGFVVKAKHDNDKYTVSVPINGISMTFTGDDVDLLCRWIGTHLRGIMSSGL